MKYVHFHATKDDILIILNSVEQTAPLKYVRTGNFLAKEIHEEFEVYMTGDDIPHLGTATADSAAACESFLVCDATTPIDWRSFLGTGGVERVGIDQLLNPDTVVFRPGGLWSDEVHLEGSFGTASDSQRSQQLMKRFHSAVKKAFTKVKAYYVGPQAFELWDGGARLTISAQSPREFDLTRE